MNLMLKLCEQIEENGQIASVALLRAKSPQSLPLPEAIKIIQHYKSGARSTKLEQPKEQASSKKETLNIEQRMADLEQKNLALEKRLHVLEERLSKA